MGRTATIEGEAPPPGAETHAAWAGLVEELHELLYRVNPEDEELSRQLQRLEARHGDSLYSELIHLLSHLRFEPTEARGHWQRILDHRADLEGRLGSTVDLRVALVSYFVQVNRRFENPKIIELRLFEETCASAYRDELTGLPNFRFFRDCLERECQRSSRCNTPLSLVMIDVDDFKAYNDREGHASGNHVLATVARLLSGSIRKVDVAARFGGEEFALILPDTFKTHASILAEHAREQIADHLFPGGDGQPGGRITVSMGIATFPADAQSEDELVRGADAALYAAKDSGKNCVQLCGRDRRSFRRIRAALPGAFRTMTPRFERMTTVDVSEGGVLFVASEPTGVGAFVEIRLQLPELGGEVAAHGRVVAARETERGEFETGIRILGIEREHRGALARYLVGRDSG